MHSISRDALPEIALSPVSYDQLQSMFLTTLVRRT